MMFLFKVFSLVTGAAVCTYISQNIVTKFDLQKNYNISIPTEMTLAFGLIVLTTVGVCGMCKIKSLIKKNSTNDDYDDENDSQDENNSFIENELIDDEVENDSQDDC